VNLKRVVLGGLAGGVALTVADIVSRNLGLEPYHEWHGPPRIGDVVHSSKEFVSCSVTYEGGSYRFRAWPAVGAFLKGFAVGAAVTAVVSR